VQLSGEFVSAPICDISSCHLFPTAAALTTATNQHRSAAASASKLIAQRIIPTVSILEPCNPWAVSVCPTECADANVEIPRVAACSSNALLHPARRAAAGVTVFPLD
jgi:hypothetical protein